MKPRMKKGVPIFVLISGLGMAAWSPASQACEYEPYVGSVCVMAVSPQRFPTIGNSFVLAMGQALTPNQNAALFSLLGTTFGGNGSTSFNVPDLRGRVIVGYDPRNPATGGYAVSGGNATIKLTVAQLPAHNMSFNAAVPLTGVTAQTTLTSLSATANLAGVVITGPATGLTIKAATTGTVGSNPNGAYLGKPAAPQGNLYTTATPDASLNAGTIAGTLSLTVGQGVTAPVTIGGAATTTIGGSASVNGTTSIVGTGADVPIMPPYLVLPYYIAVEGIYPPQPN
jgi:microcystin-dependent protein